MSDDNVIVGICGADGLCLLCLGEDRTGTDGCGSYFRAATLVEPLAKPNYVCICDPDDIFDPPDPRPRAVEGCTAHRARRVAQRYAEWPGCDIPGHQGCTPRECRWAPPCCEFHTNRSNRLPCDGACCHDCPSVTGS